MSMAPGGTPDDFFGPDWRDDATDAGWIDPADVPDSVRAIWLERERQEDAEGWTPAHDDQHKAGELAGAAACYAMQTLNISGTDLRSRVMTTIRDLWPWAGVWWKPTDRRRNLVKAGALIAAEIDRLDRATAAIKE